LAESGEELARIGPGTPTGEMGLFTGQPRSATILSLQRSTAMVLGRKEIGLLLANNKEMQVKVLQNLVKVLSQRLTEANGLSDAQARIIRDLKRADES
jgi:CRP-like cAMP-binding protein